MADEDDPAMDWAGVGVGVGVGGPVAAFPEKAPNIMQHSSRSRRDRREVERREEGGESWECHLGLRKHGLECRERKTR